MVSPSDPTRTFVPDNENRLNTLLVGILPFIEQQPLWETIRNPQSHAKLLEQSPQWFDEDVINVNSTLVFAAMGPSPSCPLEDYPPWATEVATYQCPSFGSGGWRNAARTCYAQSLGDCHHFIATDLSVRPSTKRGMFRKYRGVSTKTGVLHDVLSFRDCKDGLSNTSLMLEFCSSAGRNEVVGNVMLEPSLDLGHIPPSVCWDSVDRARPKFYAATPLSDRRGMNWVDGRAIMRES